MSRLAAALVLACVGVARADPSIVYPGGTGSPGQVFAPVVLRAPLTTSGVPFECTANSVACVTWNGSALVDAKPNTWTQNGTVPQVAANASPFVPGTAGSTNYTDAIYYSLGTDVMNVAGDFSFCALFAPSVAALRGVAGAGDDATKGFFAEASTTTFRGFIAPSFDQSTAISGSWSVACLGRAGTTGYMKVNGAAIVTAATGTPVAATGITSKIGRLTSGGFPFGAGTLYAVWMSTDTPSDALFTRIQQRALGMIGSFGEPVTTVRSTTEAFTVNSVEWAAAAGVAAIEAAGLLAQRGSTNYFLNSDAPVTQTITLATGSYISWIEGSGSHGVAVGTATATGLPCATNNAATDCKFTITGAGTVTWTKTGTVTYTQVEPGTSRTSKIHTLGAAVARSIDAHTVSNPLTTGDSRWCVDATINPYGARAWTTSVNVAPWEIGTAGYGAANTALLYISVTGLPTFEVYDAAAGQKKRVADGVINSSQHRIVVCDSDGTLSMQVDGVTQAAATTGAGTGLIGTMPATVRVGGGGMGNPLDGYVSSLNFARSSDSVVF